MKTNYTSTESMNAIKGTPAFTWLIALVLAVVMLTLADFAQAQLPTLIGSTSVTASGAGASGKPASFNWNIPAGKNRLMIISLCFERHHDGTGNNYPSTGSFLANIGLKMTGNAPATAPLSFSTLTSYGTYFVATGAIVPANANFSAALYVYRFRDAGGLPTGSTTFDLSAIKDPIYPGDDVIVNIAVFENASQSTTDPTFITSNYIMGFSSDANILTTTGVLAPASIPLGRNANEILYLANAGMTQDKNILLSPGWTNILNVTQPNTTGTGFTGSSPAPLNEPDGLASQMAYQFMPSGNASITYARSATPSNVSTHSLISILHAVLPLAKPGITGTVFNDTDGSTNVNGVVTNAGGLYVNVIDALGNLTYSATVNASGVFTIPTGIVLEGDTYSLELSKNTGTIGATPPLKALPIGWSTVGESKTGVSPYANDGANDGTISYTMATTSVTGLRYGIKFIDNDNDGVPDVTDLDDDNDGILDTNENYNCLTNVATATDPNPTASLTNTGLTIQYTESGGNVGTYTDAGVGFAGLEPSQGSTITYQFSLPVTNLKLWFADLDNREYLKINYYDENNNRITDLTPYISANIGGAKGLTKNSSYGLLIDPLVNAGDASANQLVEVTTPFLVKRVEVTFNAIRADGTAYTFTSQTPEVYIKALCFQGDTDGDLIPDNLDLDSDNDGCPDAIEGGENVTSAHLNSLGSIKTDAAGTANANNIASVNANGVPDLVNIAGAADGGNNNVGQGVGNSIDKNLKDGSCYTLVLNPDNYSGNSGTAFTTGNILVNDLLNTIVPVIGTMAGQVVVSQSGTWPAGITLNTTTGGVDIASTVNGGVYVVNYQVCVNGTSPGLCQTQTITITLCGKFPLVGTPDSYTKTGISDMAGFANGWPGNVPNGFVAIESKNKGFVITRVKSVTDIPTADLVEGMLVYDISAACIKLYNGTVWKCLAKDCN
ncbi:MAG: hypothetical protein EOO91_00470 [Pedobacter sp.]|nr:MAG: hypothetical protein EOO91_00470 [Pedobacter sp.]